MVLGFGNTQRIYDKLNDKNIISDIRLKYEDKNKIIFGVKDSKYRIKILKKVTPEIAYLAGAIAGDGNFYFYKSKDRAYPRIRLRITNAEWGYLELLNDLFVKSFDAGGRICTDNRERNCYDLLVNHRIIWLYFKKVLGLDKMKLKTPKQVANRHLFRFFLAGFFDTDGYCSKGIFGTMIGAKNLAFLRQLVVYSAKFYSLRFRPVKVNILTTENKVFRRAYTRLKRDDSEKFRRLIPLRKKKYGPARN